MQQSKIFTDPMLAIEFANSISADNTIDVFEEADGTFRITWLPVKTYIVDGVAVPDEVWTKEDGTMINCQDLELEHAKNIIRMILRQERTRAQFEQQMMASLQEAIVGVVADTASADDDSEDLPQWMTDTPEAAPTIH